MNNGAHVRPIIDVAAGLGISRDHLRLYDDDKAKIARVMYGAREVSWSNDAEKDLAMIRRFGYEGLSLCVAKTQKSLADDPGSTSESGLDRQAKVLEEAAAWRAAPCVVPPGANVERVTRGHGQHHRVDVGAGLAQRQRATVAGGEGGITDPGHQRIEAQSRSVGGF